jgi:formylglycine-generating enzyme required for sulfatase activity
MLGNVWEWTEDCSVLPYPAGPLDGSPVQVQGDCEKRAIRGGSWRTRLSRQRLTFRGRDPELAASHIFGFRIARDL